MDFLLNFISAFIIWICIDWKRNEECKIKIFSKDWCFLLITVTAAFVILKINK
jgi:hypothetical protein